MGVLNEKAVLELLLDATKGIESFDAFREHWNNQLDLLKQRTEGVELPPSEEESAKFHGRALKIVGDSDAIFQSFAVQDDELERGLDLWKNLSRALGVADPQLAAAANKIGQTGAAIGSTSVKAADLVLVLGRLLLVIGGATAAALAFAQGINVIANAVEGQNKALDYTASVLDVLGFDEAADDLQRYVDAVRLGAEEIDALARQQARVNTELERQREAVFGDKKLIEERIEANRKLRREIEELNVSEEEKRRLLMLAAEETREIIKDVERYGTVVRDGAQAERELVAELERHEAALRDVAAAAEEAAKAEDERWEELGKILDETVAEYDKTTEAQEDNTKTVEKQEKAYGELVDTLDLTISQLRDAERALRDSIRTQRDALGVDDLEQQQADLREEIEGLEGAVVLTVEQMDRLDSVKKELLDTERKLEDAVRQSTIAYDEHELANVEAELAAAENERTQQRLAELYGEAADELGGYTEAQKEATSETEKQVEEANRLAEVLEGTGARAKAAADALVAAAQAAGDAWDAQLDRAIAKLKEAKQCVVELQGATDEV